MRANSIGIIFFLTCFFSVNAQITNLQKLSSGKFYDSDVIRDANNNIKGYFMLFETDKIAKETVELEYIVLDENLTKVTNGLITEMKFESLLINSKKINVDVSLYKDKLLIRLSDDFNGMEAYLRFRILDLKTNKLSENFIFNKGELKMNPKFDRKIKNYQENMSQDFFFLDDVGLVVDSKETKDKIETRFLAHYDENFNQKWKYIYSESDNKSSKKDLKCIQSDSDVIVMMNHTISKRNSFINDFTLLIIDVKTGKLIKEFQFPNVETLAYKVVDCYINGDEISVLGNYSKASEFGFISDTENMGLFNFKFSKTTGKTITNKYIKWEELVGKLDINKNGLVKKEGYIFVHNMLSLKDNKVIVVCETFQQSPIQTNNMYFLEVSKEFKVSQVFEVTKFRNKFPKTAAHSKEIKKYGLFDFIDYQNLGDDEFLFFLSDNEKNTRNRNKSTLYGIVSYSEGTFKRQTLDLKTETSSITIYPSKKGYIMLIEDFDAAGKATEMRLEKVNY